MELLTDTKFLNALERHSADLGFHRYDRHSHDEFSVILVTNGEKTLRVGRDEFSVRPGQLVMVPPGYSHECEPLRGQEWSHKCWYLSPSLAAELLGPDTSPRDLPGFSSILSDPNLVRRLSQSHDEAQARQSLGPDLDQLGLLSEALCSARRGRHSARPAKSRARTEAYVSALRKALSDRLDLEALAELGGVTRFQVIRDFKAIHGMTPGIYLKDLRLRESRRLLRNQISLAELSQALGFADQSHFSRSFKAVYGMSPRAYRSMFA